jgi:hypothetical protein
MSTELFPSDGSWYCHLFTQLLLGNGSTCHNIYIYMSICISQVSSASVMTDCRLYYQYSRGTKGGTFLFSASGLALRPTQPPIQWVLEAVPGDIATGV